MMKKRSLVLAVAAMAVSCLCFAKDPAWVSDANSVYDDYPEDQYIAEVGYGDQVASAQSDAVGRISQYFVSSIQTNFNDRQEFSTSGGLDVSSVDSVVNETNISSQVELFAIEYSKAYYDKKLKQYCIVAYINRDKAWRIFEPKIKSAAVKFEKFYKNAGYLDDPLDQFMAYKAASSATAEFAEYYEFGNLLYPAKCLAEFRLTDDMVSSLPSTLKKLQNQCKFTVVVHGDYDDTIARKISSLLNKMGFAVQKSGAPYEVVADVTVDIKSSTSDAYGTAYTAYPGIEIVMGAVDNAAFSYSKSLKKVVTADQQQTKKKAYQNLSKELEASLIEEFTAFASGR